MGEIVTGIVGIAGVLLGLFADRILQRQGRVRCEIEPLKMWVFSEEGTYTAHRLPVPAEILKEPEGEGKGNFYGDDGIRYFINVKLFNEKEVRTGLRDVVIVFEGRQSLERTMQDRSTFRNSGIEGSRMDNLEVLNLPSREWVTLSLIDYLVLEDAHKLTECDKAWLRGYFPDGSVFKKKVSFIDTPPTKD